MKIFESLLDLIFPRRCETCRQASQESLCPTCFNQIKLMKPHMGIYSAAAYEGVLREAIHRFKFNKRKNLAEPLAILSVQYLSRLPDFDKNAVDLIVPVPLHKQRLHDRGYNQVELIVRIIGKYLEIPVLPALERVKHTEPQFNLKREERFTNITGAFKVSTPGAVYEKRVLLVDDIYTTGATINECTKTLRIAGAKKIETFTLSRSIG